MTPPLCDDAGDDLGRFAAQFLALTGHAPFPWQRALFLEFLQSRFPPVCDIPTGLGKTAIIGIWLLALATRPARVPRRLVYVVNRRTVVDQATREAEQLRAALETHPELGPVANALRALAAAPTGSPLAVSTLRGQFADNAEWRQDPGRPALVVGTVDMIGSRLLFGGYGCGFKSRPLHAGLLGQDALLVHDEAHLEPSFQMLLGAISTEQRRAADLRPLHLMALTATARAASPDSFGLTPDDRAHAEVRRRTEAHKRLALVQVDDDRATVDTVTKIALGHKDSGKAILVFLRRVEHVEKVADKLRKAQLAVQTLTGTMRGLERDALATKDPTFARFMPRPAVTPLEGTAYLVCTSAGEVGVDISADHMVCDLSPFDSIAQRLGRVNRYGTGDARVDVVCHVLDPDAEKNPYEDARARTLTLLRTLPMGNDDHHDASPASLAQLPARDRLAAFTPAPEVLPVHEILFDAWALTSIRGALPGRPPLADWLHGVAEWEPPETYIAWREEVALIRDELLTRYPPADLLEDYPLKPHELLRDLASRVTRHLKAIAERSQNVTVWLVRLDGDVRVLTLAQLAEEEWPVEGCTIVLPPSVGGLTIDTGMLEGAAPFEEGGTYDVADREDRVRVRGDEPAPAGMRLVRTIDLAPDAEEDDPEEQLPWRWYVRPRSADDDGSRTSSEVQDLASHLERASDYATRMASSLALAQPETRAVVLAAQFHDRGKDRAIWQRSIGNGAYPDRVLAKSNGKMRPAELSGYRHELGSILDLARDPGPGTPVQEGDADVSDLVLHLIAAHHGRARPCFPVDETFDPSHADALVDATVREVPRRFARLERKYGRWGLAYLESVVRAADSLASQELGR